MQPIQKNFDMLDVPCLVPHCTHLLGCNATLWIPKLIRI